MLRYEGMELLKTPKYKRPDFCRFCVYDGERPIFKFWTDRNLKGFWSMNPYTGEFDNLNPDFVLPKKLNSAYRKIKRMIDSISEELKKGA